jgi:hypothetical protein
LAAVSIEADELSIENCTVGSFTTSPVIVNALFSNRSNLFSNGAGVIINTGVFSIVNSQLNSDSDCLVVNGDGTTPGRITASTIFATNGDGLIIDSVDGFQIQGSLVTTFNGRSIVLSGSTGPASGCAILDSQITCVGATAGISVEGISIFNMMSSQVFTEDGVGVYIESIPGNEDYGIKGNFISVEYTGGTDYSGILVNSGATAGNIKIIGNTIRVNGPNNSNSAFAIAATGSTAGIIYVQNTFRCIVQGPTAAQVDPNIVQYQVNTADNFGNINLEF